ncbi:MAG TPA: hypothetical protein VGO67_04695 [Verrucomicrobiae bacterium]|jgi:hypothetical protein
MESEQPQTQSFREAAKEFDRTPKLFRQLMKYKDDIAALRQKGASFGIISELLQKDNVRVSWKTVSRFCRKIIGTEKRRRKSTDAIPPSGLVETRSKTGDGAASLLSALNEQRSKVVGPWTPRKRGPHITDSKNL